MRIAIVIVLFLLLLLVNASCVGKQDGAPTRNVLFIDNFDDGDFTQNPTWNLTPAGRGRWAAGIREVVDGEFHVKDSGKLGVGHNTMIDIDLDIPVKSGTTISFDVKPVFSDVRHGAGDTSEEFPCMVELELYDANNNVKRLWFCYNYRGGVSKKLIDLILVAYPNIPQDQWQRNQLFNLHKYWPTATKLKKITIGANGWNYEAYFDNIKIGNDNSMDNVEQNQHKPGLIVEFDNQDLVLIKNQSSIMAGKVKTADGQLVKNKSLGLDDGLRKMCTTLSTDNNGHFEITCTPSFSGTGVLVFHLEDYPICYKAIPVVESAANNRIASLPCQSVNITNVSNTDLKAILTVNMDNTGETVKYINLPAKKTTEVIKQDHTISFPFKLCHFSGMQFTVGMIAGGEASVTLDCENNVMASVSGGGALMRGTIYWLPNSKSGIGGGGICWSPGGDIGMTPNSASGEVSLCIGTDGLSISGDMSLSAVVGGYQLQIVEF